MTKTLDEVTVEFDHHEPAGDDDLDRRYTELMHACPVSWSNGHGGYWILTLFDDVYECLRDYRTFSSRDGLSIPPHPMSQGDDVNVPVDLDPPEHSAYRRALNPLLTKEAVADLLPRITYWTHHYLDEVIERGECDLVYDVALTVPAAVTLEWIGWENRDEWRRIGELWHDLISCPLDDPKAVRARADVGWFSERIDEEIADRRASPRDDLISYIAHLDIDGAPIPAHRAMALVRIAVAGGVDTTQSLIGSALVHLHRHPEHRRVLSERPELWETATDEFLRRYPPVRNVARTVTGPVEMGSCRFEANDRVLVSLTAANLDEHEFGEPFGFDPGRSPNRQVAFGAGIHRCVGLHLARAEFIEVMRIVLERIPDYALIEEGLVPYERQSEVAGWTSAPATFTPGLRVLAAQA